MSRTMALRDEHVITYRVVDARDGVKHNAFYQPMTRQDIGQGFRIRMRDIVAPVRHFLILGA